MAGIHDVHMEQPPPEQLAAHLRRLDPELLRRQAAGQLAAGKLEDLQTGSEMARALRMQNMEMPKVVGEGYAAQGPTFLQGLATMASNRQGATQVNELEAQARALRGETNDAALAQLQAQDQAAQLERQARAEEIAGNQTFTAAQNDLNRATQIDRDNIRAQIRADEAHLRNERIKGEHETYVDPATGETFQIASTEGGKMKDGNGNVYDANKLVKFKESKFADLGPEYLRLEKHDQKDLNALTDASSAVQGIAEADSNLTEADRKALSRPVFFNMIKTALPGSWETWAANSSMVAGLSPAAKNYLERVANFSADIRNKRFGSALTWNEIAISEAFDPSAGGIDYEDRSRRIGNYYKFFVEDKVRRIDHNNRTHFLENLPRPQFSAPAQAANATTGAFALPPEKQKRLEELRAKRGR